MGFPSPNQNGPTTKAGQKQFLVKIVPESGVADNPNVSYEMYWARKSGGETSATSTKVFDGGNPYPYTLPAVPETSDLTLSKPYDYATDPQLVFALRPLVGRWYAAVTVTAVDMDYNVIAGSTETYHGLLASVQPPTVDAGANTEATLGLTFAVAYVD